MFLWLIAFQFGRFSGIMIVTINDQWVLCKIDVSYRCKVCGFKVGKISGLSYALR